MTGVRRYKTASDIFEQVIDESKPKFDANDHFMDVGVFSPLALLYIEQHRFEEAADIFEQMLEARRKRLGNDDDNRLEVIFNLAIIYEQLGSMEEA